MSQAIDADAVKLCFSLELCLASMLDDKVEPCCSCWLHALGLDLVAVFHEFQHRSARVSPHQGSAAYTSVQAQHALSQAPCLSYRCSSMAAAAAQAHEVARARDARLSLASIASMGMRCGLPVICQLDAPNSKRDGAGREWSRCKHAPTSQMPAMRCQSASCPATPSCATLDPGPDLRWDLLPTLLSNVVFLQRPLTA